VDFGVGPAVVPGLNHDVEHPGVDHHVADMGVVPGVDTGVEHACVDRPGVDHSGADLVQCMV